ncbi:cupin domain-containing protein [Hwanghaeella sp.]|uniref:cupin domain-containing protein n=1 Tax=Hwanghaeella sp. TaxID=2605943 RepID=UPI003CCC100F
MSATDQVSKEAMAPVGGESGGLPSPDMMEAAEIVLPCRDFDASLEFYRHTLGFKIETIYPADSPSTAIVFGHGVRLRLERGSDSAAVTLRLTSADPAFKAPIDLVAPNGARIIIAPKGMGYTLPPIDQSFVFQPIGETPDWGAGRAGMLYRDLIPNRQGGRFIASHIKIPVGGPVPDYVHFHKVRFQMIYCKAGWVRLAYEDQGEPFIMKAGDCVLQPPEIRHRVLECSDGLEVVEIGCPAEHPTMVDHTMTLPTDRFDPERDFNGQLFVWHEADKADWHPWRFDGFVYRDLGIEAATHGLARVRVAKARGATGPVMETASHKGEFLFFFALSGHGSLVVEGEGRFDLSPGDSTVIPADTGFSIDSAADGLEVLEIGLPAEA